MFDTYKINKLEKDADVNFELILEDDSSSSHWKEDIKYMRLQYISLKEKFKNDKKKLLQVAIDWKDYSEFLSNYNTLQKIYSAGVAGQKESDEKAETEMKIEQIQKRFNSLLKY